MPESMKGRTGPGTAGGALRGIIGMALFAAGLGVPVASAADYHRFAAPAAWVRPMEADQGAKVPDGSGSGSGYFLLIDRQIDINERGDEYYQHIAIKVLNAAGVDEFAQFDLTVDPTFETLDIHRLRVVREGVVIDQRKRARITELPQETELSDRVFNGRYNVNVVLSDVRADDVIEYSYTLHSRELLFPGHYYMRLSTGWSVPLGVQRIRVRAPVERPLAVRASDATPVPAPRPVNGRNEVEVVWRDLTPVTVPDMTPGWHVRRPFVEIADRRSWADVARVVAPLYRPPAEPGPKFAEALDEIRRPGGTPAELALRALQYVQEEIRYTSISIGPGSYRPSRPELVLERRFGDCKDKSFLLATLLDRLGIEARAALVHSTRGRALDATPPTPYAFDHVVVRAVIDGAVHWLDPTGATQYSPLSSAHHPDFERALVVDPSVSGLEVIGPPAPDMGRKEITSEFDLTAGVKAAGTLTVTTLFKGATADEMRPDFATGSAEQRRMDYESYTARYFPGARSLGDVEVQDDLRANVLTVRERYRLEPAFTPDSESGLLELWLHADELYPCAEALGAGARQAPLALEYPLSVKQRIVAKLPKNWPVRAETVAVDNPAFRYRSKVGYAGRTLTIDYEYQALAASVAPEDIAKFESDRARVYDDLGYRLTSRDPAVNGDRGLAVAPLPMFVLVLTLLVALWAAIRWGYRYDPPPQRPMADAGVGIGGWLVLPALSMVVMPVLSVAVVVGWLPAIEADLWHKLPALVNEASAGSARLAVLAILMAGVAQTVLAGLTSVLFFTKRTSAPRSFAALTWFATLLGAASTGWAISSGFNKDLKSVELAGDLARDAFAALIWTMYMFRSNRVKATFIRRRGPTTQADIPPLPGGLAERSDPPTGPPPALAGPEKGTTEG